MASITASHFPTCINRDGNLLRFEQAITRIEDDRTTLVPASISLLFFKTKMSLKIENRSVSDLAKATLYLQRIVSNN